MKTNSQLTLLLSVSLFLLAAPGKTSAQTTFPEPEKMTPAMSEFWNPQPRVVAAADYPADWIIPAPSDAEVLFDGTDLSKWESSLGGEAKWPIANGIFTVDKKLRNIQTKKSYGSFQLHLEWRTPLNVEGDGQQRGNSGIAIQGKYEIQILSSYENPTYNSGHAGSVYKQSPPLVNVTKKPGEWNIYDIIYTAPTFKKDGTYLTYPYITIIHNGVVIQNNTRINGGTVNAGFPRISPHGDGPIILQAHRDPTTTDVSFRNIWIREL